MKKHTDSNVKEKTELARQVVKNHFGSAPREIEFKPAGKTNFVFEIKNRQGDFIIRIADAPERYAEFVKEEWAIREARSKGIPVPDIVDYGNELIHLPYMIQEKLKGKESTDHPKRLDILCELGGYARSIHSIHSSGFGHEFEKDPADGAKLKTWASFIDDELHAGERLQFLSVHGLLPDDKYKKLELFLDKIRSWEPLPALNHGDLRLKNVIVNRPGKIQAIIDWGNCVSAVAPYWDFSIALHDLSIDGKQQFLEGYGLDAGEFESMSYALTVFNLINYIPALEKLIEKNDYDTLKLYKLRLNGSLDLFSL